MPELPISMSLLRPLWYEKISILGSVYGLYLRDAVSHRTSRLLNRPDSRRLEAQVGDAHRIEEDFHELHQAAQSQPVVGDDAFYLVELAQMSRIHRLVSNHMSALESSWRENAIT